jgi:hypothetical protein
MRPRLTIIMSAFFLVAGLGSAILIAQAANKSGGPKQSAQFVGYWMGIDPLDGGDVRRGITANDDGTFSMIGHDSVLTLCGGTDRGIITVSDFTAVRSGLVSDNHVLTCTNGPTLTLRNHIELIDKNIIRETVTTQEDEFVDETIYHRVSER